MNWKLAILVVPSVTAYLLLAADAPKPSPEAAAQFSKTAAPVLQKSCTPCHNEQMLQAGFNASAFVTPQTIHAQREGWEKILQKIKSNEMPPPGLPRPTQPEIEAMSKVIEGEWERLDRTIKPDPGRVTARRLNRAEYTNTIRDLLAVDFRADRDFPTDDSGYGFDNIGDVLTISPVLMEKYLVAAERISARAIGADPIPTKEINWEYHTKDRTIRRLGPDTIECTHRVDWEAEYLIRIGLPGEREADAKPVTMGFWMDGKLIHTMQVETKPSGLVYFNPYSEEQFRLILPEGEHTFRAGFINDDYVKTKGLTGRDVFSDKKNKALNMIKFIGPYPAKVERASRKKILTCDPATGNACIEKILTAVAHRAYRRPVTRQEVASLMRFVNAAKAEKLSAEQGLQLAIQAILVSPHFLFRIERDPNPTDAANIHRITDLELASRLSYFLWSSAPDDELLALAESNKLRNPGVLEAQIKRMLANERAGALAANFAGQWLETRNLDSVKPDPGKFPEWGADLREAMKTETKLFFEHLLRENRPMSEFLDARYTFLNDRLARHYGIEGVKGPEFRRVDLATDQRGGILGHASVLTVSSYPTRTSVVIRGKYILQNLLGTPPPPPPPDVPALDEDSVGNAASLRQQMEKHRANAMCASCHRKMDSVGFGLENYDAIGRWRAKDGKFDIESAGMLPNGKKFNTPAEMRSALKTDMPGFSRCLVEKMLTYALGRGLERYDRKTIDEINRNLAAAGYPFQNLVFEIARSLPFQSRRGEAVSSQSGSKPKEVAAR
ncbi:MAG: DUF1592 domain-containing protein [Acidobacteria bacterium]|nr:DUF1592 domain-containing protein [Acidobacteriota bacterium]